MSSMPERLRWLECPVCPGVSLTARRVTPNSRFQLDHCERCGGVWFDRGETTQLRRHLPRTLWAVITRSPAVHTIACRSCDSRFPRHADECPACSWRVVLDCPVCDRPMVRDSSSGVKLDGCRTCRGAWFDNVELEGIWKAQAALAVAPVAVRAERHHGSWDIPLDGVEVVGRLAAEGARGVAEGSMHIANAAGSLPEVAGAAFDGAASLVEVVGGMLFDALAAILEGVFGALG